MSDLRDLPLATYAAIRAALAERDRPLSVILIDHNLTVAEWTTFSATWDQRLASDDALATTFSEEFVRAQDTRKPIPPMTPDEWARLSLEAASGGLSAALSARRLSVADHARLSRHFARLFAKDRKAAGLYSTAFCAAAPKLT